MHASRDEGRLGQPTILRSVEQRIQLAAGWFIAGQPSQRSASGAPHLRQRIVKQTGREQDGGTFGSDWHTGGRSHTHARNLVTQECRKRRHTGAALREPVALRQRMQRVQHQRRMAQAIHGLISQRQPQQIIRLCIGAHDQQGLRQQPTIQTR